MILNTINTKLVLSFIVGFLITFFLLILVGAHYDSDERVFYYVINSVLQNCSTSLPATNNDFILFNLYLFLKKTFINIDVFSWSKVFFFSFSLSIFIYFSSRIFETKLLLAFVIILFLTLFIDVFLLVNHVRTSTYISFVALVVLFFKETKRELILYYTLVVFAILNRIEISIINFAMASIISVLFRFDKKITKHIFISVFISSISLASLWLYNQNQWSFVNDFFKYERSLEQNKNFILSDSQIQKVFSGENRNKEDLIAYANGLFLIDEPYSKIENLGNYIKYKKITDYVFKNPNFISIYINKLEDIYLVFIYDLWHLLIVFLIVLFLTYKKICGNFKLLRLFLFLFYFVSNILILNIFTGLDFRTLQAFFIFSMSILLFNYLHGKQEHFKFNSSLIFILVFLLSFGTYRTFKELKEFEKYNTKALSLNNYLLEDKLKNKIGAFILDFTHYEVLPSKVFSYKKYNGQFLSMGHFEKIPLFENRKIDLLGNEYNKLPAKFDYIIDNNIYIYSNVEMLQFQQSYLEIVHHFYIEFEKDSTYNTLEFSNLKLHKYKLSKKILLI